MSDGASAARVFDTPWGRIGIEASGRGVTCVVLPGAADRAKLADLAQRAKEAAPAAAKGHTERAEREVREYLAGRRQAFTVPVDLDGVPTFHRQVLRTLVAVRCGETVSYGALAARAGRPRAARAVGQAMARNPVPLLVPCHRVVASGGRLGGFGGGPALKRRLLDLEASMKRA